MIGHGRPSSLAFALARVALVLCALVTRSATGDDAVALREPVRLRITWGGGEPSQWVGRFHLDNGTLSSLKLLNLDADAAGAVWLDQAELRVDTPTPHKLDRIEVVAEAGADAKLLVELAAGAGGKPAQAQVPLAGLHLHPFQLRLDDRGRALQVELVPSPALQISLKRDSSFYVPGEQLSFELTPMIANALPGTTLDIQTTLTPARGKDPVWSDTQRLAVPVTGHPKAVLDIPLPQAEGVYTIHITALRPPGFRQKFLPAAAAPLAERSFQIVVLDPQPPAPVPITKWDTVLEIDPTNPRWVERLPNWSQIRFIPGLNRGPLGSIRAGAVDLPLGRFIELPPTVAGADPHWQAYSLPLQATGVPHVLEIDYPADTEQHFGISIVEPNAAGVMEGIHRDAGVYVEGLGRSEAKQKQTQRLIFWPRTQAPLLVITNQHPTAAAHFGQIRVLKHSTGQLSAGLRSATPHERLIAAYIARPLAAETFGATQALESVPGPTGPAPESVDDAQTFYECATRLADYVRYGGYNSAIVSVMAEGSAIFPSPKLLLTPRYDSGRSADRLRDSDGLELMLRVFDRDQLKLLPAIEYTTPIAELERLRHTSDPQTSGLELIGADGRTWLQTHGARGGLAPYYNLLDPRVQQAMLEVVRDIVTRYGEHAAFGGLAVQLSGDGYSQLPPLDWGFDDATIARFERDTRIQLNATGASRFKMRHDALTGEHVELWRSWRAAQISSFYAQLAAVVRGQGNRQLLLTTEKLFDHPQLSDRIRPKLLAGENRVATTLLDFGLDRQVLAQSPGVVLCPTRYVEPMAPLQERAIDLELNEAFAHWRQQTIANEPLAAVLYHRPIQLQLASFKAQARSFNVAGEMRLVGQPVAHGVAARQPYLQALVENNPAVLVDGGDLLPLGQEDTLRGVRALLAELPISAQVSAVAKQPVIVQTYTEADRVTIVAMNMSPWRVDAQAMLELPQAARVENLAAPGVEGGNVVKQLAAGQQPWPLKLGPYDIQAVRIPLAGAKVVAVEAALGDVAKAELSARVTDLANRDLSAQRVYGALANPSFEPLGGAGELPGWRLPTPANGDPAVGSSAELDATAPQDGHTCLYFHCDGKFAAVESDAFPTPSTGQLAMTVYVRGQNLGPGTLLRLVFESERGGQVYRQSANVDGTKIKRADQPWGAPFAMFVDDLPLAAHGQMRIRFELTGPGEVWLDNVKLYDLLFPLQFYQPAQAEILKLLKLTHAPQSANDGGQVTECIQLLDGYWPRFVQAYTKPTPPKVANVPPAPAANSEQPSPPQANESEQPAPSVGERLKSIVPRWR